MANACDQPPGDTPEAYRVCPEPPEPVAPTLAPMNWGNVGAWGCVTWMIVYFVGGFLFLAFLLGAGLTDSPTLRRMADWWLLPSGILGFAIAIVVTRWKRAQARRALEHQAAEARQAKEEEAKALTAQLLELRESARQLAAQMPLCVDEANASLQCAEEKFNENAAHPFWDAVQRSALQLARWCATAQALGHSADRYYGALRGRQHTFPPFPVQLAGLPDPMPIAEQLQALVRRGQTNAPLAMVWESYKTHHMAVSGFSRLEQAIDGLPEAASGVTELLKRALSSDLERG